MLRAHVVVRPGAGAGRTSRDTLTSMKWQLRHDAGWVGDAEEVTRLLDRGANPNQVAPTNWRQTPLGRTLEFRITSPRHAGHVETVRVQLRRGADPTVRSTSMDMTPFELATFCGLEPAAELLRCFQPVTPHPTGMTDLWLLSASRLSEPAKLEEVCSLKDAHQVNLSWRKATPLMIAVGHAAHYRFGDELLKAGADPNAGTAILHASDEWHFEYFVSVLRYLVQVRWKVNSRDSTGQTALHKAAFPGYTAGVRVLLDNDADPGARDSADLARIDVSRQWRKAAAVKALAQVA